MEAISFVAPVALKEPLNELHNWRSQVNSTSVRRVEMMLKSFLMNFDQRAFVEFQIVCPEADEISLKELIAACTSDRRFKVWNEDVFFRNLHSNPAAFAQVPGWYKQQLIKLFYWYFCPTSFYMTMDSDVVTTRKAGLSDLFASDSVALTGVETASDYQSIYTAAFALAELRGKGRRYFASQRILGYERPEDKKELFFSETPVVLNKSCVAEMLRHLRKRYGANALAILIKNQGWTEYSLYFQFLEMIGTLSKFHSLAGRDQILSLETSVWQASRCYRLLRLYDREHFLNNGRSNEGPFVAIQSLVPDEAWLPSQYRDIADFYQQFENWLQESNA